MIKRLRLKFICINMAIVTVMLVVIFGMVLHFTQDNLRQQSIKALSQAAEQHRRPGKPGDIPNKVLMPFFTVEIDSDGMVKLGSSDFFDLSDEKIIQELIETVQESQDPNGVIRTYKLRYEIFHTPTDLRIVFMDISAEMETLKGLVQNCILIGILSFLAFLAISILLARWAIRPVEEAWNQQRQFVADASHELKTPLTVITTNAELLQDVTYSEAERSRFSESILIMSRQMRGLVESLLELARVDNGTAQMQMENLNFSEAVSESLLLFEPIYFEKDRRLESLVEEGLYVQGSLSHLQQVLEILLDNGVKYSDLHGCVTVRLLRKGSHCFLSVSSPGASISKEDLTNIFKRFYRIDKARSMNQSYGLGLSIAWSIIENHGGKIWAESINGINTFFVQLNLVG